MSSDVRTDTLPKLMLQGHRRWGHARVAMRRKRYGIWQEYTWEDIYEKTRSILAALIGLGLGTGDKVAIAADCSPEWVCSELAVQAARGIVVGVRAASVEETRQLLTQAQPRIALVQDEEQVRRLLDLREDMTGLQRIVFLDHRGLQHWEDPVLLSLTKAMASVAQRDRTADQDFEARIAEGTGGDTALMLIASERGRPLRLLPATHSFLISSARTVLEPQPDWSRCEYVSTGFPGWFFEQTMGLAACLLTGRKLSYPESRETLERDLREIAPQVVVRRSPTWDRMASQIAARMRRSGWLKSRLFEEAISTAGAASRNPATRAMLSRLRDREGLGRLRAAYAVGNPMSPQTTRILAAIGVIPRQIYGSTRDGIVTEPPLPDLEIS